MAKRKKQEEIHSPVEGLDQSLSRAERYVENNLNVIGYVIGGIVGVFLLYQGYVKYIHEPGEEAANRAMYAAQQYFEADSLNKALNGYAGNLGFLDVADEHSGTDAGNLANYYAGMCYMGLGQYANAIEYLDNFSSDDGTLNVLAFGAIGDAFHELNQAEDALDYYEKAAALEGNDFTTSYVLKKAAQTAEMLQNWDTALKHYKRLKNEFPDSKPAADVDKFIAYCELKAENS